MPIEFTPSLKNQKVCKSHLVWFPASVRTAARKATGETEAIVAVLREALATHKLFLSSEPRVEAASGGDVDWATCFQPRLAETVDALRMERQRLIRLRNTLAEKERKAAKYVFTFFFVSVLSWMGCCCLSRLAV